MKNKYVLILCQDPQTYKEYTYIGKVSTLNANLFKVKGDSTWYEKNTIIEVLDRVTSSTCLACDKPCDHKLCNGIYCFDDKVL